MVARVYKRRQPVFHHLTGQLVGTPDRVVECLARQFTNVFLNSTFLYDLNQIFANPVHLDQSVSGEEQYISMCYTLFVALWSNRTKMITPHKVDTELEPVMLLRFRRYFQNSIKSVNNYGVTHAKWMNNELFW